MLNSEGSPLIAECRSSGHWRGRSGSGPARPGLPKVPYEDHGACPFECWTYRSWTVKADTPVRTDRRDDAAVAFRVRAGEQVDGRVTIREPIVVDSDKLELRPGEVTHVVNYIGEGATALGRKDGRDSWIISLASTLAVRIA